MKAARPLDQRPACFRGGSSSAARLSAPRETAATAAPGERAESSTIRILRPGDMFRAWGGAAPVRASHDLVMIKGKKKRECVSPEAVI